MLTISNSEMVAGSSSVEIAEMKPAKRPAQGSSRKGCIRGKGGPENAMCTYKGVRQRIWGKWVAALAYDAAARKLYGSQAKLNLPDQQAPKYHRHQLNPHLQHQNNLSGTGTNPACYAAPEKDIAVPVICNNCANVKVDQPPGNYNYRRAETQPEQGGMKVEENMTSGVNNKGIEWMGYSGGNMSESFPVFDDSIWTEASLDLPVMADQGNFGGCFGDINCWETMPSSLGCMM
ncbi:dehydration-responsive element-binding protein 2D-like [Pyrus ussuriensis x Pyrus communis]|uniref:Dehydration-responsive element-binding protein 2D-like n=1 Tax=Pyrus ussuriensis x Pyrus communis TaxID=2448454 RepID=A0A5N5GZE1_9ROSA|nr:dehydration-responsive element-binding protein 2D-like [Pyrus ussuriensis x Pyrus communis]